MSVAFRRESDDEHLEPKFEIPIPTGPNLVTARGLAMISQRVIDLEKSIAGLTDDAALTAAKRDLRYWQTRQVTAELMPLPSGSKVEFGTSVSFLMDGKTRDLALVGDDEADPAGGMIAYSAPLARALMGAAVGEVLPFGGKDDALEILAIAVIHAPPQP